MLKIIMMLQSLAAMIAALSLSFGCHTAGSFNDLAEREEKETGDVLPLLDIEQGSVVADLGAGGGYYSVKLARVIGEKGKVYAVDISAESVEYIKQYASNKGVSNIEVIHAEMENSKLPKNSVDMIFVRNTYHDIQNRITYFNKITDKLKTGGRIVIIDYDPAKLGFFRRLVGHYIEEKLIVSEMQQAGYSVSKRIASLKKQSCNIFAIKESP